MRDEQDEREYVPFLVNKALSFHLDCVFYANEMNLNPGIDKPLQYKYLLQSVRGMKRKFQPWQKASELKDLTRVKEYFGYSNQKAKEALSLLTEEQIAEIREKTNKGGVNKK